MARRRGGSRSRICAGRRDVYDALRRQGKSKRVSAKIANAGCNGSGRRRMARKAARTRKLRGQ